MEIWALSSDKQHSRTGMTSSCFHLEDRYCFIKPRDGWLLPVAVERAIMQKRSLLACTKHLWREKPRDMSSVGAGARDQIYDLSSREGHGAELTRDSTGDHSLGPCYVPGPAEGISPLHLTATLEPMGIIIPLLQIRKLRPHKV